MDKILAWVPINIYQQAQQLGVKLHALLDDSQFAQDIGSATAKWYNQTGIGEAGDAIIIRKQANSLQVLMIERNNLPFRNALALPGGFKNSGESFKDACIREMYEEVGVSLKDCLSYFELGLLAVIDWDPRFVNGVNSYAMCFWVADDVSFVAGDDAKTAQWIDVMDLARGHYNIGFVHSYWLALAFSNEEDIYRRFNFITTVLRLRNQQLIKLLNRDRRTAMADKAILFAENIDYSKDYIVKKLGL